jgi:hypothetical protein
MSALFFYGIMFMKNLLKIIILKIKKKISNKQKEIMLIIMKKNIQEMKEFI